MMLPAVHVVGVGPAELDEDVAELVVVDLELACKWLFNRLKQ
jgi:hypothetical protein